MFVTVRLYLDFLSFLLLINPAYLSQHILGSLEYFPFIYPNLLHVQFLFQIFNKEFSIHFCPLNTCCFSSSFHSLLSDHPKTIFCGKVSRSYSLWNSFQPSESSCIFVTITLLSTPFSYILYLCPTLNVMFQVSQSLHF